MEKGNLKEIRLSKYLLQREVAKSSGIGTSYYCLLEKGERIPSFQTAKRIASALDLTLDELYEVLMGRDHYECT